MTQAQYIRRDEHPVQPVIYRLALKGVRCETWRCSEREWFRMVQQGEAKSELQHDQALRKVPVP